MRALVLLAALLFGALTVQPPELVDPAGPADFDHRAAWQTLTALACEPHPIGSPAHEKAAALVSARLTALGLAPQVQSAVGLNGHATTAGLVKNIVARLDPPGGATRDAILLVTHYDSRIASFGAGDDGAAVAALLDVMRALKNGPPLARSVIFLCTDGEEQGLLGAEAFASLHPWARDVGVVLNFEARGSRGPALLFETSPGSAGLVRAAAEVAPRLTGTSLAGAVYRTMPNDTDLSVFLRAHYAGLNFAFNQGWAQYHTRHDDPAHLDPRSLAHHGRIALALVRRLSAGPLPAEAPDEVFFNLLPGVFLVYGVPVAQALAGILALALVFALWRYPGRYGAVGRACGAALSGIVLAVLWAVGVSLAARYLHGMVLGSGDALRSRWYHLAVLLGAAGLAAWRLPAGEDAAPARAVAALALWTALAVATAIGFAPGSYLFAWPALLALPGLLWSSRSLITRALLPAPAAVLLGATGMLFFESLGNDVAGAGVTAFVTALTVPLAASLIELSAPRRAGLALFSLALAAGAAGAVLTRATVATPDQVWLAYGVDADARAAQWLSLPQQPGAWLAARMGATPEIGTVPTILVTRARAPVAHAPAPAAEVAGPAVAVVADRPWSGGRNLTLRVTSPRGASQFWLALPAPRIHGATLEGRALPPPGTHAWGDMPGRFDRRRADPAVDYTVEVCGVGPAGIVLELALNGAGPLPLRICDVSFGLPGSVAGDPPPDVLVPYDFGLCTLVARSFAP